MAPRDWASAIVPGAQEQETPKRSALLRTKPFAAFLSAYRGSDKDPASPRTPPLLEEKWRETAQELLGTCGGPIDEIVRATITEAGKRLAQACWSIEDERSRATESAVLCKKLFDAEKTEETVNAVRGLLLVRGLGDALDSWFPEQKDRNAAIEAPTFRLHTFFRSIEGLYAPVLSDGERKSKKRPVGSLSLERKINADIESSEDALPPRQFEVLYCECCGELMVGGMRAERVKKNGVRTNEFELLPNETNLDGLPDSSSGQLFEGLSYEKYAVFWPSDKVGPLPTADDCPDYWAGAILDPETGIVKVPKPDEKVPDGVARGWVFKRREAQDNHGRDNRTAGTNVPYMCPACATDYSPRRSSSGARLSPIRHFRTGFAKTTQLLASELFSVTRLHSDEPKLVSFSDSRQDAAKAALDIEKRHHEDMRREVIVKTLNDARNSVSDTAELTTKLAELKARRKAAIVADNDQEEQKLSGEIKTLNEAIERSKDDSVPIGVILEDANSGKFHGAKGEREPLKTLIKQFVDMGVHPTDPAGTKRYRVETSAEIRWFEWHEIFEKNGSNTDWRDDPASSYLFNGARTAVVRDIQKLVVEVLFNRTYFSVEESGLGYLTLPRAIFEGNDHKYAEYSTFLRVFGDAYRFQDSPYDNLSDPWLPGGIPKTNRVMRFAVKLWGTEADAQTNLRDVLDFFKKAGHDGGLIRTSALRMHLAKPEDDYWRCPSCARVHLHHGAGICTRCFSKLRPVDEPSGKVAQIHE
jgi:hypothetical protein